MGFPGGVVALTAYNSVELPLSAVRAPSKWLLINFVAVALLLTMFGAQKHGI